MTLDPLFSPEAVAVIGHDGGRDDPGAEVVRQLLASRYRGAVYPVFPSAATAVTAAGVEVFDHPRRLPRRVDLAVVSCPPRTAKEMTREAMDAGARAVVLLSSGFKESGSEGAALEESIAGMCRTRGVHLLGPNTLGLLNTANNLHVFVGEELPPRGGLSIISQSSSLCSAFLRQLPDVGLGAAKVVNLGNKAGVTEVECLRALGRDQGTTVIAGYLENIEDGDEFVKAAEEASLRKPVVLLKGAVTEAGRRAVAAHCGEMIASDTAYGAAFKRAGVLRAETFGALVDFALAFSMLPLPAGDRVLVLTNAGGAGIMAVDAVVRGGLSVCYLDQRHRRTLAGRLPASATLYNPVDLLGDADGARYRAAVETALDSPNVDAVLVLMVDRPGADMAAAAQGVLSGAAANTAKPVLASFVGRRPEEAAAVLGAGGMPVFDSPEHAVAALAAMWEYVTWRRRPPRVVTRFKVNRRRVERVIARRLRTGRLHVSEVRTKAVLDAYDFAIPAGRVAGGVDEAVEAAGLIGFPVAMKIVSPDITHKSSIGGVRLDIPNRAGVVDAFDLMMLRVRQKAPDAFIEGVYVEKMLDRGVEFVLGMRRDAQFGPMLMFGLGGIFVEVLKDVAFYLAPVTFDEAVRMLKSTRSYRTMLRARGEGRVDLTAMAVCLQKLSQLATDFPRIADIEINLMMAAEEGGEPQVADARMTLSNGGGRPWKS